MTKRRIKAKMRHTHVIDPGGRKIIASLMTLKCSTDRKHLLTHMDLKPNVVNK